MTLAQTTGPNGAINASPKSGSPKEVTGRNGAKSGPSKDMIFFTIVVLIVVFQLAREPAILDAITETSEERVNVPVTPSNLSQVGVLVPQYKATHKICQKIVSISGSSIPSAASLWTRHFDTILKASYFPRVDRDATNEKATHNLLLDLSPSLLQRALLVPPKRTELERILSIVEKRQNDPSAPPLKVLVMGGSVTEGSGCEQNEKIKGRSCNWSRRLDSFLKGLLGSGIVQVFNIANGGTNSEQALSLVRYWLYPDELEGAPDIIINAFGTNDSFLGGVPSSEDERVINVFRQALERLDSFCREVKRANSCPAPIVFHLDEYVVGHSQGAIIGDRVYRMVLGEVASWHQNFAVSSSRVVGPLILPDPKTERAFSPKLIKNRKGPGFKQDPHFGWRGHQAIVWSFAYSLLQVIVNFCELQEWEIDLQRKSEKVVGGRNTFLTARARAVMPEGYHPPSLNMQLAVEDVSKLWRDEAQFYQAHCSSANRTSGSPCVMAWVAGPEGRTSTPGKLMDYLKPFLSSLNGWNTERDLSTGWSRKLGLVASNSSGSLEFSFPNVTKSATSLIVHSIKSYGEKWNGSMANFRLQVLLGGQWTLVAEANITGFHNSTSSISYSTTLDFRDHDLQGQHARIQAELIGGQTFKITGMMLCNH